MFDIGSAVVLGLVVMGLVALVHSLVLGTGADRIRVLCCLAVSVVAVVLVAASDFAGEQVLLDHKLSTLNFASQMIVALLLAGLAAAAWQGVKAVSNIGVPMPKYPTAKLSQRHVAPVAGTGLTGAQQLGYPFPDDADNGYPGGVAPK